MPVFATERLLRSPLLIEPQAPIDGGLFEAYARTPSLPGDVSALLLPPKEVIQREKDRFYAEAGNYNPDLRPRELDVQAVDTREAALLEQKDALPPTNENLPLANAYRWTINEQVANLRLLRAAYAGDDRRFQAYNSFVYGPPDRELFAAAADWFCADAERLAATAPGSVHLGRAADSVLEHLGNLRGDRTLLVPDPDTFVRIRDHHFNPEGFYSLLLNAVELPDGPKVSHEQGNPVIRQVLDSLASDLTIREAPGAAWGISRAQGAFMHPKAYNMPRRRFLGLALGHEITHELETQNGLRSRLRLGSLGLDRYEAGNEGRGVLREQVVYPEFDSFAKLPRWQDIMRRHLATSLAEGLAGERMSFSEVYRPLHAIDMLYEQGKKPDEPADADKAAARTWRLLGESIFKGTDGTGGAYRRYKIYLEGNVACWRAARNRPELIAAGDLGKFDISNLRHIAILQAAGVLPQEVAA